MTSYNSVSNGSKREQIYKCGWLWQTGYYAKTKRKGGRGMREGWIEKRFDEVFTLQMGKTPDRKNKAFFEGTNTWVSIKDLGDKYILSSHECISDEAATNISIVKKGTVIMSFKLTVGKCAIAAKDLYTNEAIMAFNIKDGYEINSSFLYYYLKGYKWNGANKAVMGLTLNKATISKHNLSIPPLSTQQSIVSELDKINELIRLKKEQLKDYDNLAQSIFYEMFGDPVVNEKGWEVKKLGEVALIKTGPFGSMLHKEDYITGGIPLINPMHIQNFKAVPDKDFSISKEKAAELCNYQLKINDVIFARRGDIGRCAVISDKEAGCLCGTGSLFVRFERKLSSIYTMYVVRTTSFIKELVSKAKGATMLNLNSSTMENLRFPLPPLPLQQLFAQRIELIEKQKAEVQRTIKALETLLASRMQYWFD